MLNAKLIGRIALFTCENIAGIEFYFQSLLPKILAIYTINRGYYMPARGYEFYLVECSTRWLRSERGERVRYRVEHEKIKFISTSARVIVCLLYKHANNDVFDDFPKFSDHFPKISEYFPKLFRRLDEPLRTFFEHYPKISEVGRRFPRRHR